MLLFASIAEFFYDSLDYYPDLFVIQFLQQYQKLRFIPPADDITLA